MFAVKITDLVRLKQQWEEHQRLEAEHERRRSSRGGGLLAPTTPRKTKAPTLYEATSDATFE